MFHTCIKSAYKAPFLALCCSTKKETYRIPTAQEILAGKKVLSTLDHKDGYWQVELDDYYVLSKLLLAALFHLNVIWLCVNLSKK